jgi:hypothetical protein
MAATAPVVLLAVCWEASYHQVILVVVACCALSGVAGLSLFVRALRPLPWGGRALVGAAILTIVALVGAQMTWTLRPYVVRPRTEAVPFVRALEGSFIESVTLSTDSARGVYHRELLDRELGVAADPADQGARR